MSGSDIDSEVSSTAAATIDTATITTIEQKLDNLAKIVTELANMVLGVSA